MLLLQKLRNEIIANHRQEICIASGRILSLRNVNFFNFRLFILLVALCALNTSTDFLQLFLLRLIIHSFISLLFQFELGNYGVLILSNFSAIQSFSALDPAILIHALAIQHHKPQHSAIVSLVDLATHIPQIQTEHLITTDQIFLMMRHRFKLF